MDVFKDDLIDLQESYDKVRKLLDEDSRNDPANEPYRSKYAASAILTNMKSKLVKILDNISPNDECYLKFQAMLGAVWLNLGTVSLETEELSTGEEQLSKSVTTLSDSPLKPEIVLIMLSALNQQGILWSQRDLPEIAKQHLERAEKLYKDFTTENPSMIPISIHNLFLMFDSEIPLGEEENSLEKTHTLTLYYLAQVYGNLNDHLKSAVYCHTTLKRQLEYKDFDPVDWALNSATLSQYFMEKGGFQQARHHLAAAVYILDQYKENLNMEECGDELMESKKEQLNHRSADVARCWAKYGLMLLTFSRDRLMQQADDEDESLEGGTVASETLEDLVTNSTASQDEVNQLWFTSLELSNYEEQVTDKHVLMFDDARKVFLNAQEWLNRAMEYYTLENCASDYVQIVQDLSQLFKYLAFFEEDEERQSRMQKRRVDHLEAVLKELNPQYYLLVCRQLWFELAEIYSEILDIKLQRLQACDERPTPHALRKVNHLVSQSIHYFDKFLESLRDTSTNEMPSTLSSDVMRPAMLAYFRIGRLNSKFIQPDKAAQLENVKKSLDAYMNLVTYCDSHKDAREQLSVELSVCEEMVKLLPLKLEKLRRELNTQ
uniref:KIF-binding protein n=1 Tax=Timema shepardi TaxID=629360 RepID=A0A7R9FYR5_TIMSH|nr:unnamed protein product [Timema shepardi]